MDVQQIARGMMKSIHYKLNTRIQLLKKDRKVLSNNPEADTCNNICTSEALINNQLKHLTS